MREAIVITVMSLASALYQGVEINIFVTIIISLERKRQSQEIKF